MLVSGVNLFEVFRVGIDWSTSRMAFTRQREARYPLEDFEFFEAEASGKADDLLAYLRRHPKTRLGAEAAAALMKVRLEDRAPDDGLVEALQWIVDTAPADRRLESCMEYVRAFAAMPGRSALVQRAGAMALKSSRAAVTVQDTYRLHNLIGESLLAAGNLEEAWKHFLSAAFMPLDNQSDLLHNLAVNLNLARVYDRQDRYARAYSRYKKALALMRVKVKDRPTLVEFAAMPENPDMPPDMREYAESARRNLAEIDGALKRLRPKIPAGNRVLLEG
jgi:tetratricopeptide (TPR) repeat protein